MAEAMLRQRLLARGVDVRVSSAGLLLDHEPAHPYAVDVLRPLGLDLTHHRSRILSGEVVEAADLVLCMEQRHVREVLVTSPDSFHRTYTLPDLVLRAEQAGPRVAGDLRAWLERVGAGRKRVDVLRADHDLEVPDPIGGTKRQFRRTADTLGHLLDRLVPLAWPRPEPSGNHGGLSETTSAPVPRST